MKKNVTARGDRLTVVQAVAILGNCLKKVQTTFQVRE